MNLRKATEDDIVEGDALYIFDHAGGRYELIVDEIHSLSDPWQAFTADDGCRYGLDHGLFVLEFTVRDMQKAYLDGANNQTWTTYKYMSDPPVTIPNFDRWFNKTYGAPTP